MFRVVELRFVGGGIMAERATEFREMFEVSEGLRRAVLGLGS
jgi:hypothetical protein